MAGKWIDIVVVVFLVVGVWRGFRRGLIREVFSLLGVLLAVAIAFHRYQELSVYFIKNYSLLEWQAQLVAFGLLALGISLLAILFGFLWSRVISFTPFALVDNIAGAGFGIMKVLIVVIAVVVLFESMGIAPINNLIDESYTGQQVSVFWPHLNQWLEDFWPDNWDKPVWLFPPVDLENAVMS